MATYFSSLNDQRDDIQMSLLPNEKHSNYQSSALPDNFMYMSHDSAVSSYPDLPSGDSLVRNRDEMLFIPPTSDPSTMQPMGYASKPFDAQNVDPSLQYQGLSLSLAMQVPSSVQVPYANTGFSSLMSSHIMHSDQGNGAKSAAEYLSFDLAGGHSDAKMREMSFNPHLHDVSGTVYGSKYLRATQELLDEVVSVHTAVKRSDKSQNVHSFGQEEETDMKSSCSGTGVSSDGHKSGNTSSGELSAAEKQDLENKMTKLFSMLDEVDRKYKQYYQQMQGVVSSFEMVAGLGSARPYTALALRTISCQFRCLRDAIKKQIQATRQSLGEQGNSQGERLYRLRYVDQQLRQQRSLQQFGMMRQPWRPQRGLPENAVSVLRAWLFEHFLHPYPKDSEKLMLARQTGLTRSQVANWFINARVRLWKPMIEDMYKEEFGEAEGGGFTVPEEQLPGKEKSASDDRGDEEVHESLTTSIAATDVPNEEPNMMSSARLGLQDITCENEKIESSGFNNDQHTTTLSSNQTNDVPYGVSMFRGVVGDRVSLALGLQHHQNDPQTQHSGTQLIGDDNKADYYYMDPANQQERFASSHLLPDFVV